MVLLPQHRLLYFFPSRTGTRHSAPTLKALRRGISCVGAIFQMWRSPSRPKWLRRQRSLAISR